VPAAGDFITPAPAGARSAQECHRVTVATLLLGPVAAAQATLAVLVGIWALVLIVRHWNQLGRAQSMVHVLTNRVPLQAHARQASLSSREHEVLELIRTGVLSDSEIARALHISPATAATHVQRILRKTGLHNRRDLMLLPRDIGGIASR
jgi:DNA-binding CsgD family transcriptional regulator